MGQIFCTRSDDDAQSFPETFTSKSLGQSAPHVEDNRDENDLGAEWRQDTFALWPGLEKQLEILFTSLDLHETGHLSYSTLEPVLRHQLMQIGLMEYISRYANEDGSLNPQFITDYLHKFQIDLSSQLSLTNWKNLMLSWILYVQDSQHRDIEQWQCSLKALEDKQAAEYQFALAKFQDSYLQRLEKYYKTIEADFIKDREYRDQWENSLELQEQFYNIQSEYIKNSELSEKESYERKIANNPDVQNRYFQELRGNRCEGPNNLSIVTFAYPIGVTTVGAPVSGGAQPPTRRRYDRLQRRQGCC